MAREMAARGHSENWQCPQLPASPKAAIARALTLAQQALAKHVSAPGAATQSGSVNGTKARDPAERLTIIGSSLGGYYATWLAEHLGCRAILLNPSVFAPRDLATQVGEHRQFHTDEPFVFLPHYVDELKALWIEPLTRMERYFLVAAKGDEVLDWRDMAARYAGAEQLIIEGGDHGLSDFAPIVPRILTAAGLAPAL